MDSISSKIFILDKNKGEFHYTNFTNEDIKSNQVIVEKKIPINFFIFIKIVALKLIKHDKKIIEKL